MNIIVALIIVLSVSAILAYGWGLTQIGRHNPTINTTIGGRLAGLLAFLTWAITVLGEVYIFFDLLFVEGIQDVTAFIIMTVMLAILNSGVVFYFIIDKSKSPY